MLPSHPPHPLFRRFENKVCVAVENEDRTLEWYWQDGDVFFRPVEEDVRFLWAALDVFGRRSGEVVWHEALANKQLRRAFFLQNGESVFLGEEEAIVHQDGTDYGARFHIPGYSATSLLAPQEDFEELLLLQSRDPLSDLNVARKWLNEAHSKWTPQWQLRDKNGHSPDEVWEVLKACTFVFKLHGEEYIDFYSTSDGSRVSIIMHCEDESAYAPIGAFLNWVFDLELKRRRLVRGYSGWLPGWMNDSRALWVDDPTQHERLEALLV